MNSRYRILPTIDHLVSLIMKFKLPHMRACNNNETNNLLSQGLRVN
jgi:hypothetical protein